MVGQLSRDLTSPRLLAAKGVLFLIAGGLATLGLGLGLLGGMEIWVLLLLHALAVWAFCRAYYFAFYVIEKYVAPGTRYAGLGAAARQTWRLLRASSPHD